MMELLQGTISRTPVRESKLEGTKGAFVNYITYLVEVGVIIELNRQGTMVLWS